MRQNRPSYMGRDHPRACGEHLISSLYLAKYGGSSPRMRGTRGCLCGEGWSVGIIPAHAGNTPCPRARSPQTRDHPRACGEHPWLYKASPSGPGSSPRMRGTRGCIQIASRRLGIIPAHAGNTTMTTTQAAQHEDHPRACGEHGGVCCMCNVRTGSSPRMRGTQLAHLFSLVLVGIIPAHAGNTTSIGMTSHYTQDHPRACGEHAPIDCWPVFDGGSSPRMRGTLAPMCGARGSPRIIPAHAGNTLACCALRAWARDHPRACGEHFIIALHDRRTQGSSPRMRGTPHRPRRVP